MDVRTTHVHIISIHSLSRSSFADPTYLPIVYPHPGITHPNPAMCSAPQNYLHVPTPTTPTVPAILCTCVKHTTIHDPAHPMPRRSIYHLNLSTVVARIMIMVMHGVMGQTSGRRTRSKDRLLTVPTVVCTYLYSVHSHD